MGKRGNAFMIFLVLFFDALMCGVWYVIVFLLKSASTLDTVGSTVLAMLGSIMALVLTYIAYDSCVSEED